MNGKRISLWALYLMGGPLAVSSVIAARPATGDDATQPITSSTASAAVSTAESSAHPARAAFASIATTADSQSSLDAALQFELAGDNQSRRQQLEQLTARDPEFAPARWHAGQVKVDGEWTPVEKMTERSQWNAGLAEYLQRREAAETPQQELALAEWLVERDPQRARVHYWNVVRQATADEQLKRQAADRLGLVNVDGQWLDARQVAEGRARQQHLQAGLQRWLPSLAEWDRKFQTRVTDKQLNQFHELLESADPPIIAQAIAYYAPVCGPQLAIELVDWLGKVKTLDSSGALVALALDSPLAAVSSAAIQRLQDRDLHHSVPHLLERILPPMRFQHRVAMDSTGTVHADRVLVDETDNTVDLWRDSRSVPHTLRVYNRSVQFANKPDSQEVGPDSRNDLWARTGRMQWQLNQFMTALKAHQSAAAIGSYVAMVNNARSASNGRVFTLLETLAEVRLEPSYVAWSNWWTSQNDIRTQPMPKSVRYLQTSSYAVNNVNVEEVEYLPKPPPPQPGRHSCFDAGTLVFTERGEQPIEEIRAGDRVLSQNVESGELSYEVVAATTLRPPTPGIELTLDSQTLRSTAGHPYWVVGHGWKMAQELEEGDRVHCVHGAAKVESIQRIDQPEPKYNLVVPSTKSYFVGSLGALVQDNREIAPTPRRLPGWN